MARRIQSKTLKKQESMRVPVEESGPSGFPLAAKILLGVGVMGAFAYVLRILLAPIMSSDLWFHLRAGEWILANHRLPPGDLFSIAHKGHEWILNSWLSEVFLWEAYHLRGAMGVMLLQLLIDFAVLFIIAYQAWRLSGRPTLCVLFALLAVVTGYYRYNARPELFTMLMILATVSILYQYKFKISDRIWWLIPLGALWPNLHMGFIAAVAILGCFLLGEGILAAYYAGPKKKIPEGVITGNRLKRLAIVSAGMMVATLFNPYGLKAWFFVTKVSSQFSGIAEWSPLMRMLPLFSIVSISCMVMMVGLTLGSLLLSRRPQDLTGLLLATAFGLLALRFTRQINHFCLIAPFVAAAALHGAVFPRAVRMIACKIRPSARASIGAAGFVLLVVGLWGLLLVRKIPNDVAGRLFAFGEDRTQCSYRAIEFMKKHNLVGGKLFDSLELGGWVILKLWPKQSVYIDGRIDMYGLDALDRYLKIVNYAGSGPKITQLDADYCYFRRSFPNEPQEIHPSVELRNDPNWALVYFDDTGVMYARREPRNAKLLARGEYKILSGSNFASEPIPPSQYEQVLKEVAMSQEDAPDSAYAQLICGAALKWIGKPQEAVECLERGCHYGTFFGAPTLCDIHDMMARACLDMKDQAGAVRYWRLAISDARKAPNSDKRQGELMAAIGQLLVEQGKTDEAEAEFQQAMKLGGDMNATQVGLGCVKMKRKQYQDAANDFEAVVDRAPDAVPARVFLAECLTSLGKTDDALQQLETATQFNRGYVAEAIRDPMFAPLRGTPRFAALLK